MNTTKGLLPLASVFAAIIGSGCGSVGQPAVPREYYEPGNIEKLPETLQPFWYGNIMRDETVLMVRYNDGEAAYGRLAFTPKNILSVRSFDEETEYGPDDYELEGNMITRVQDSAFPFLSIGDLSEPDPEYPSRFAVKSGLKYPFLKGNMKIKVYETSFIVDRLVKVTYEYDPEDLKVYVPVFEEEGLPNTMRKLRNGETIRVLFNGDSVVQGGSSSGFIGVKPYLNIWPRLICDGLEAVYGYKPMYFNTAAGGKRADWGNETVQQNVIVYAPDLVIIRFTSNEIFTEPWDYYRNIKAMIDKTRAALGDQVEFILVSEAGINPLAYLYRNQPLCIPESERIAKKYEGVVHVNMQPLLEEFLKNKFYWDIATNNFNHNNDFFVRIYAQAILAKLVD
jgi:hypothetical protein